MLGLDALPVGAAAALILIEAGWLKHDKAE